MDEKALKELRELVEFLKQNDVAEFNMEREDLKVGLVFASAIVPPAAPALDAATLSALLAGRGPAAAPSAMPAPAVPQAAPAAAPAIAAAAEADPHAGAHAVKSPIVGTFYDAPSPGKPAFVKIGDRVDIGQVLCIVEAMKLMNEIESDVAGEVVAVLPKPGQPVEYGQTLFAIK
jgi:acetyl-CoA carboxylase biotin carboxyl carrier protein